MVLNAEIRLYQPSWWLQYTTINCIQYFAKISSRCRISYDSVVHLFSDIRSVMEEEGNLNKFTEILTRIIILRHNATNLKDRSQSFIQPFDLLSLEAPEGALWREKLMDAPWWRAIVCGGHWKLRLWATTGLRQMDRIIDSRRRELKSSCSRFPQLV
ncbi:hypothetical protein C8R42DRAFT_711330 [Lentinula raphanica]|nr:hypothetical protein C8R42DRAFT_711330 [Lentinula raphanica]